MQDYKIRIPNADLSRQVQEKAFELGYIWASHDTEILVTHGLDWIILYQNGTIQWRTNRQMETSTTGVQHYPEISYQDFLRLGEIDVNNCKIRLNWTIDLDVLSLKLRNLGIIPYGNGFSVIRSLWSTTLDGLTPPFILIRSGKTIMVGTEQYFNQLPEKELTVAQIMQLQPTINNTTTEEIMSGEITLKCITAPRRAKNITVDRDYTGILIDSDDSQVDTLREATHFRCVNNNGIEAKYKLALFTTIAPPPPPKITQQQFLDGLNILADRVSITFHGDTLRVLSFGYNTLSDDGTTCSCGIHSSNGLDGLWDRLEDDGIQNTSIIDNYDADDLIDEIFKAIVLARVHNINAGLVLFSTTEDSSLVCELMDWLADNQGGYSTEIHLNPNSGNQIKAWLIPKN